MGYSIKILFCFLVSVCMLSGLHAQINGDLISPSNFNDDITQKLPHLSVLQEQAIENSPIFKILDADVSIGDYMVKEEQRKWMSSFGIEGGAKYGLFDNLIISEDLGLVESNTQTTEQMRYYLGAYMKIPISDIVDRSNVRVAKAEKQKLRYQREASIQELRKIIIICYNDVVKQYRGLAIKASLVESYRLQMMRAKLDFNNGDISIYDYARLDAMWSKASLELEDTKLDYTTAYQILEETVGVKIQLKE